MEILHLHLSTSDISRRIFVNHQIDLNLEIQILAKHERGRKL